MPRLLAVVLILVVSTICLPSDWSVAQESKQKCQECPVHQTANAHEYLKFELPGVDFPIEIQIEVEHNKTADDHAVAEGSIEIKCECLKNSGIPFLSNMSGGMGKLFTNVGLAHVPACAAAKTESCDGPCCATDNDCRQDACQVCEQASKCGKCDGCPVAKTGVPTKGVPIKGSDRLFTAIHASTNSSQACEPISTCQACVGCSAACAAKKIQSGLQDGQNKPLEVQLAGYVATSAGKIKDSQSAMHENVMELRLQNERLKMEVEAAEMRLEMMEAVMELREENAILRTKIEFLQGHGHATTPAHSPHHAK